MLLSLDFTILFHKKTRIPQLHGIYLRRLVLAFLLVNNEKIWAQKLLRLCLVLPEKISVSLIEQVFPGDIPRPWRKKVHSVYRDNPPYVPDDDGVLYVYYAEPYSLYQFKLFILDDYFSRDILNYLTLPESPIFFGIHNVGFVDFSYSLYFPEYFKYPNKIEEKYIFLEFYTPTRFELINKKERFAEQFPTRRYLVRNLINTWNDSFPDNPWDLEEMTDFVQEYMLSRSPVVGPIKWASYKRKPFKGFMGYVVYGFKDLEHPLIPKFMDLLTFGVLVGTGTERFSGYGRYRFLENSEFI